MTPDGDRDRIGQWMRCMRGEVAGLAPTVTVLFLLVVAVPQAGVYYHQHPGGDRAHVHADDASGLAELIAAYRDGHDHVHPDHEIVRDHSSTADRSHPAAAGAEFAPDAGPATGHWHQQDRFQRAVQPGVFVAQHTAPVHVAPAWPAPAPVDPPALTIRVRGPPPTA